MNFRRVFSLLFIGVFISVSAGCGSKPQSNAPPGAPAKPAAPSEKAPPAESKKLGMIQPTEADKLRWQRLSDQTDAEVAVRKRLEKKIAGLSYPEKLRILRSVIKDNLQSNLTVAVSAACLLGDESVKEPGAQWVPIVFEPLVVWYRTKAGEEMMFGGNDSNEISVAIARTTDGKRYAIEQLESNDPVVREAACAVLGAAKAGWHPDVYRLILEEMLSGKVTPERAGEILGNNGAADLMDPIETFPPAEQVKLLTLLPRANGMGLTVERNKYLLDRFLHSKDINVVRAAARAAQSVAKP